MHGPETSTSAFCLEDLSKEWGFRLWRLVFDLPDETVNKLNQTAMRSFEAILPQLESLGRENQAEALVVSSGKRGNFIAGADLKRILSERTAAEGEARSRYAHRLMTRLEDLPFPTVSLINGVALGGGLEFALSCSAILMSDDPQAKIGLPEVTLGLIPGIGGCTRLPNKVGLATALDMILTGKTLNGDHALKAGVIEAVLPRENFETNACTWVKAHLQSLRSEVRIAKKPKRGGIGGIPGALLEGTSLGRSVLLKIARAKVLFRTQGRGLAPLEVIDVMRSTGISYSERKIRGAARDRAIAREVAGYGRMASSEVSENLIREFFQNQAIKKAKRD